MAVKHWSPVAAENANAGGIDLAEGMNPNAVNDGLRQILADLRTFFEEGGWMDWGHACSYAGPSAFAVPGDLRAVYHVNRRVRAQGVATGTIHGTITAATFVGPHTTVGVQWPPGSALQNEALAVALGPPATGWPAAAVGHPGTVKAWIRFSPKTGAIAASYNVTAISTSGAGLWTITFDRDMGNTAYLVIGSAGNFAGDNAFWGVSMMAGSALHTGSCTVMLSSVNEVDWYPNSGGDYAAILVLGDF